MSYTSMSSYYTFSPHEIMSGMGRVGSYYTFSPHEIMSGFGAVADTFDPAKVMADIATSDSCYGPGGTGKPSGACNAAGQRVGKEMAAALNALGYGPLPVDGTIGSWKGAYDQYLADHGLSPGPGFGITQQALLTMKQELQKGQTPGPGEVVEYEKVGGEYVPKTGMTRQSKIALGVLAAAGVAALAVVAVRKKKRKKAA